MSLSHSESRAARFDHFYTLLDLNRSGTLDRDDFMRLASRLRSARGWSEDDPGYSAIVAALDQFWTLMLLVVDEDDSGEVDRREFTAFEQLMAEQTAEFAGQVPPWVLDVFTAVFTALDTDGDGQISIEEYRLWLDAIGSDADADAVFPMLDLDGSGHLEISEVETLLAQFFTGSDDLSPGAWFVTGGWPGAPEPS